MTYDPRMAMVPDLPWIFLSSHKQKKASLWLFFIPGLVKLVGTAFGLRHCLAFKPSFPDTIVVNSKQS